MNRPLRRQAPSWRVSLLALFITLVVVTSASAECAWVLWTKNVVPADGKWGISSAHANQQQCQAALKDGITLASKNSRVIVTTDYVAMLNADGTPFAAWLYFCLPDTVDPRGPKGK